jgi:hypothetical protein
MWNKVIDDWKTPVEYIDREAANLALAEQGFDWDKAKQALASVPAADVVPVVHGRWDDSGRYTFPSGNAAVRCTNCGYALTESEYHLNNWNYCPVCGAKMDGGADND